MNHSSRILPAFLIIFMIAVPCFSQEIEKASKKEESSKSEGLRKIVNNSQRNYTFDIRINHEELEANIEAAVENAIRSVEVALENLERMEIHIDPIEINMENLDVSLDPIVINIPDFNIDIEPIEIDLDDVDNDFDFEDEDDSDWENNDEGDDDHNHDKIKHKEKNKHKSHNEESIHNKSDKNEKDKSKGLKKLI
jgi:hypothetical protein